MKRNQLWLIAAWGMFAAMAYIAWGYTKWWMH